MKRRFFFGISRYIYTSDGKQGICSEGTEGIDGRDIAAVYRANREVYDRADSQPV